MSAPVWVLSVDLQTKTATFTTGLADAARSAKGSFNDIRSSAADMGSGIQQSSTNVRAAIGLIDNTIRGSHAMAMADLVREFSNTRIVMMALPFAATVAGFAAVAGIAVEAYQHFKELRAEQEKLTMEQARFGTTVRETLNGMGDKLLEAGKRVDELRGNHVAALQKELQLIDHQSLDDLMKTFDIFGKNADQVLSGIKSSWYTMGVGSEGVKHSLEIFNVEYKAFLAARNEAGASNLLENKLKRESDILAQQRIARAGEGDSHSDEGWQKRLNYLAAYNKLQQYGVGFDKDAYASQVAMVGALQAQKDVAATIADVKKDNGTAATLADQHASGSKNAEAAKQAAASQLAIAEQQLAADKAMAEARLTIQRASIAEQLQSDISFADRDLQIKLAANAAERKALDGTNADYANQVKESKNKALELTAAHTAQVAELTSRASVAQNTKDITDLEAGERQKIAATQQGSQARLSAIDAATAVARAHALQDTDFYRTLGTERVETARQMADAEAKIKAEAGKEEAENSLKMGEIALQADIQAMAVRDSAHRVREAQRIAEQEDISNREFTLKLAANLQQQAALDTGGKDYENKLKALQNRELQLIREHENQKTAIKDQAEINRNTRILAAENQFNDTLSRGLTSVLMRHQSFASMLTNIGDQVVTGMMENAIKSVLANDYTKESDAAKAARKAYNIGLEIGGPAGFILGPAFGATAFASVMAFAGGTDSVPGVGRGDIVPAMLTPGEAVIPNGVVDNLSKMARNGGFSGGGTTNHITVRPTYKVNTIDGDGMKGALKKHNDVLVKHVEQTIRKMNR